MNRRNFLKTAGRLTAGSMLMSASFEAFTQTRKEVRVGGRPVTVVDIHDEEAEKVAILGGNLVKLLGLTVS